MIILSLGQKLGNLVILLESFEQSEELSCISHSNEESAGFGGNVRVGILERVLKES